jgi:hypothetical protein
MPTSIRARKASSRNIFRSNPAKGINRQTDRRS